MQHSSAEVGVEADGDDNSNGAEIHYGLMLSRLKHGEMLGELGIPLQPCALRCPQRALLRLKRLIGISCSEVRGRERIDDGCVFTKRYFVRASRGFLSHVYQRSRALRPGRVHNSPCHLIKGLRISVEYAGSQLVAVGRSVGGPVQFDKRGELNVAQLGFQPSVTADRCVYESQDP